MKKTRNLIIGLLVGLVIGLWCGINIGKDKPLFSNPFAEKSLKDKIREAGEGVLEKSGEALEKTGKAIREKLN